MSEENVEYTMPRADGSTGEYNCGNEGSGLGYNQECGGWENVETGEIYAIANWGSHRHWNKKTTKYVNSHNMVITSTKWVHGFQSQMIWWFNENDIDTSKLTPIKFRWSGAPVGDDYILEAGPAEGQRVSESLPCTITRPFMHAVRSKAYATPSGNWSETNEGVLPWVEGDGQTMEEFPSDITGVDGDLTYAIQTDAKITEMMMTMEEETMTVGGNE